MLEEEKHERPKETDRRSEARTDPSREVVQPLCDCSSSSSSFVVFTCPKCMGVALRALEEVFRGKEKFFGR